jgi:pyrroline-5-carboxylate reductase
MLNILQIGCGNMGAAILDALSNQSSELSTNKYSVIDPHNSHSIKRDNISYFDSTQELPKDFQADIIIFAVKPQIIDQVITDSLNNIKENGLIISILAGTPISYFKEKYPGPIIRIMPNLGAKEKTSMSFLYGEDLNKTHKEITESIAKTLGKFIWLKNEEDMHHVTAVSGSGPAYYFLFFKIFSEYLQSQNFTQTESKEITLQTAQAAIKLADGKENFDELIEKVTSKGGTTEAALSIFTKDSELENIFKQALDKAAKRSKELSS